jgi:hypothetical protein
MNKQILGKTVSGFDTKKYLFFSKTPKRRALFDHIDVGGRK